MINTSSNLCVYGESILLPYIWRRGIVYEVDRWLSGRCQGWPSDCGPAFLSRSDDLLFTLRALGDFKFDLTASFAFTNYEIRHIRFKLDLSGLI